MKKVLTLLLATIAYFSMGQGVQAAALCPDGSYVSGNWCHKSGGKNVGDSSSSYKYSYTSELSLKPKTVCPDGSRVDGECELTPSGRYVGR